jgi:ornithine carrier protein
MWFGSYEGVSAIFRHYRNLKSKQDLSTPATITGDGLPVWQQMSAGAMAGMTYNFICYPADTIKSRMQTADFSQTLARSGKETFWGVGRSVWKQQGLRGLYQGCGLTVARAIPGSAFIFAVYERLRTLDREFFGEIAM